MSPIDLSEGKPPKKKSEKPDTIRKGIFYNIDWHTMETQTTFEKLKKSFSIEGYHKQGIADKRIVEFIEKGKIQKTLEHIIKGSLEGRLEPYKPILDCLRSSTLYFLCESKGVPDCIQYIKDTIILYVNSFIGDNWDNFREGAFVPIEIPNSIFDIGKVFFNDCKITVEIALYREKYPLETTDKLQSNYIDGNTVLKTFRDKDGQAIQRLANGEFMLRVSELAHEWVEPLSRMIYHEFTHAYQDYNMLLKNQNYKNEGNYIKTKLLYANSNEKLEDLASNPQKCFEIYGKYADLVIDCCNAVYVLCKMEQNAFISQAYSEMDDYIRRKGSNFTYEEVIEHTSIYDLLYNLSDFLIRLKETDDGGMVTVGFVMMELDGKAAKDENECAKEYKMLVVRIEKAINNVYKKLTRLIGGHCVSNNFYGCHGKINTLYNRIRNINRDK